ncbi:ABC transporter substrate-binding protein [Ferrovibrio xuzhouensis]|uniref:ABC transporter substrate-binding protein n=1 Tax=Ferrovibrio xuzhouensis TaxID=1576914 RepID=A0ABV7VK79_9PROT
MPSARPNRRRFIQSAGTLAAAASFGAPFISSSARAAGQLVFAGFGGAYQEGQTKALFEPFERETGIKIVQTTGVDLAKLRAQVQSGNIEWDFISLPDRLRYTAVHDGLLMPLDYSVINNKKIVPELVTEFAVGGVTIPMLMAYSTKYYPSPDKAPKTWVDFWNIGGVPGQRGMYNGAVYTLEFALIADGVPKDKLYPLDLDRAFRSLDKIKSKLIWWSQMSQPGPMLASGEIHVTPSVRAITAMLAGEPIGVSYDGAALTYEAWVVPKGTKNAANAMKFINFALQGKNQAELTKYIAFGPTNSDAAEFINPKVRPYLSSNPENAAKGFLLSGDYWGPNLDKVMERWNEWRLR